MKALVVYESMFGNTAHIARAIGAGLAEGGVVVTIARVDAVDADEARGRRPADRRWPDPRARPQQRLVA